jgi:hypothetical protein
MLDSFTGTAVARRVRSATAPIAAAAACAGRRYFWLNAVCCEFVSDRLWEMVDVVDVLDASEAKRKREPKVIFDVVRWRIGEGYYVSVAMPGNEPKRITETFATEGEAWRWIRNESAAWLFANQGTAL